MRPNYGTWLDMFKQTMDLGTELAPRGEKIKELDDFQITVDPIYPFMNFKHRGLKIDYFKKEMLWKLTGDPFNQDIKQHAKMWGSVQNNDGSFNSNYGQYWFGEQMGVYSVINELIKDVDSRRAIIPMLRASHIGPQVKDTVCTEAVGFRIRNGRLNMSIHMRSSDQVFGLGTDIPTFAFLYRLVKGALSEIYNLENGWMTITAMSSHIYERHFNMVNHIIADPIIAECSVMPTCDYIEAMKLISCGGQIDPKWGLLSRWLLTEGV